ncbi:response regulator [Teredinibacter sp. KSP-S5-2]|uniref:response regulator n=1 Tax=Teredinibacter sp. KSP-S5-2 TaxID=3034506 RepID=UPI0029341926|nr:response regulator [Teredinibacter sp. KSP-S5-2]WNO10819.1 response regulator [Teredinibacter sp. KSP-S5-2]
MRILLVEDDDLLGEGVKEALSHFSYTVEWLKAGKYVVSALQDNDFSLVILDLGLPDVDGLTLLKEIRQQGKTIPVLILTARDQLEDKLLGLNTGADDYMIKPFDVRELEARIRTLTRRFSGRADENITLGHAQLDLNSRVLLFADKRIEFSRREFPLIKTFFENPNKVFTRDNLESLSYGWEQDIESNALEVHIHNLRKKIGTGSIKTIRGVGYMLVKDFFH